MDLGLFLGRFHPLIVHLPIGIILVTLLLEWLGKASKDTLRKLWWYGFLAAVISAFIGWLLAGNASYAASTLRWHKWLGFATCGVALAIWAIYKFELKISDWIPKVLRIGVFVLLGIGGHKGGTLTHGDGYLVQAAPGFIQKLAGFDAGQPKMDLTQMHPDSILTFQHLVNPILEHRCLSCHNTKALNGGLDMSTVQGLFEGGDGGAVLISGDATESELFKRLILSQADEKFMPPKGIPMTFNEIEILKSWISQGVTTNKYVSDNEVSLGLIEAVQSVYDVDISPRPWYLKKNVAVGDSTKIQILLDQGIEVVPFSQEDNYLKVVLSRDQVFETLDFDGIEQNIIILEAKHANLSDDAISQLGSLPNLMRLDLSNSKFDPKAFLSISDLSRLESINLFNTPADDELLDYLASFSALQRLFTWQSKITSDGITAFESKRNDVTVEHGINNQ